MHAVAQGTTTDIALLDSAWVAEFAERGYLHALPAITPYRRNAMTRRFGSPVARRKYGTGELMVPGRCRLRPALVSQGLVRAEGSPPPQTWQELLACARYFQRAGSGARYDLGLYPLAFAGGEMLAKQPSINCSRCFGRPAPMSSPTWSSCGPQFSPGRERGHVRV